MLVLATALPLSVVTGLIDTKVLVQFGYSYVRDILFEDSLPDCVKITFGNSEHLNKSDIFRLQNANWQTVVKP